MGKPGSGRSIKRGNSALKGLNAFVNLIPAYPVSDPIVTSCPDSVFYRMSPDQLFAEEKAEMQAQIDGLKTEKDSLQKNVDKLQNEENALKCDLDALEKDNLEKKTKVEELEKKLDDMVCVGSY